MDEIRFARLLWIVKAALLAVLLYLGFGVITSHLHVGEVFDPGTARGEQPAADLDVAVPQTLSAADYAAIVERNFFTENQSTSHPQADVPPTPAPKSVGSADELSLRLVGAIAGGPVASRAILQNTKTNTSGSYKIGDSVASATIQAIQRDAVVLRHQGKLLVLKLQTGTPEDRGQKPRDAGQKTQAVAQKADNPSQSPSGADATPATASRAGYVADVFRKATIEPYVRNDHVEGLRISGLENIPLAGMFGFKNGDVVQSIDGQSLTSKQKAFQVLMKARTQSKVNIRLLRDGKNKDLSFSL